MSEFQEFLNIFEKNEWTIPTELETYRKNSLEYANKLREILNKKLTYEEILKISEEASKQKIRTQEIKTVLEIVEKSKHWFEKAQIIQAKWVAIKTLQRMVNELKGLPIMPYTNEVKERHDKAHEWYFF